MKFGDFEIRTFVEHTFRLDGGTMFGVIPRSLWQKKIPPDDDNLIEMKNNLFVLKAYGKTFLFDAGLGDTLSEREKKIYGITTEVSRLEQGLVSLGLTPDDIDYIILTHLHADHAAGAVKLENGRLVPRFPNAKVIVSQKEWNAAMHPNERTSAVYAPHRYQALLDAVQVEFIKGDAEIFPGINTVFTGGHSDGHFVIELKSGGQKVFYYADIFPTSHHLAVPYIPATDVYPNDSMEVKRRKLPEIIAENVIMAFDHDIDTPFGWIRQDGKRLVVEKVYD